MTVGLWEGDCVRACVWFIVCICVTLSTCVCVCVCVFVKSRPGERKVTQVAASFTLNHVKL